MCSVCFLYFVETLLQEALAEPGREAGDAGMLCAARGSDPSDELLSFPVPSRLALDLRLARFKL